LVQYLRPMSNQGNSSWRQAVEALSPVSSPAGSPRTHGSRAASPRSGIARNSLEPPPAWLRQLFAEAGIPDSVGVANCWVRDSGCKLVDLVSDEDAVAELIEVLKLRRFDARRLQKVLAGRKSQLVDGEQAIDPDELLACKGPAPGEPVSDTGDASESARTLQKFGVHSPSGTSGTCTFGSRSNSRTFVQDEEQAGATSAHARIDGSTAAVSLEPVSSGITKTVARQSVEPPEYLPGGTGTAAMKRPKATFAPASLNSLQAEATGINNSRWQTGQACDSDVEEIMNSPLAEESFPSHSWCFVFHPCMADDQRCHMGGWFFDDPANGCRQPAAKHVGLSLIEAAGKGDVSGIQNLLAARVDVSFQSRRGWSALHTASGAGHLEAVRALLAASADPNVTKEFDHTPLHQAVGHNDIVQILLRANANPLAASVWGGTPLAIAKVNGHFESARLLQVAAVQENWSTLKHAVMELCTDREFILAAVQRHWEAFEYATEELRGDREIVLAAVRQNGDCLECAARELKADREVVLAAVRKSWRALEFAAKNLQADREIVMTAVKQNWEALDFAAEEIRVGDISW